jgi:1-acyl-sn-glycerol-3-phosphate acyltransferase
MTEQDDFNPYLSGWLFLFRTLSKYFRFECEGFEHLRTSTSLIVGYHGSPFPVDVFMLSARVHDELGYMLPAIWLRTWGRIPVLRSMVPALNGFLAEPTPPEMAVLIRRRQHLVVLPGGSREGMRPFWRRYELEWGSRVGYLKLALRYDLPIIPIASSGTDEGWWGLVDGYRLSKRLFGHGGVPVWLAVGPLGLWPFSPPFPVKVRQRVGAPIDLKNLRRPNQSEDEFLRDANDYVKRVVQGMLDELNGRVSSTIPVRANGAG